MKVLFAVLNMGLGHATRSLGLIQALLKQKIEVTIVSTGRSLLLLKQELQESYLPVKFIEYPDYNLQYSKNFPIMLKVFLQIPKLLHGIKKEMRFVQNLFEKENFDIIISDHRYGFYHKNTPSFFITHQLLLMPPRRFGRFKVASAKFHALLLKKFNTVLIPDFMNEPNLSGELSHHPSSAKINKFYAGPWSSAPEENIIAEEIYDFLALISGPEPQRTVLEEKVLDFLEDYSGKAAVILGKPGESVHRQFAENITVHSHLERKEIFKLIQQSKLVICRSGYSTVMELAAMKKPAIFIPTPGQSEQAYLAEYYAKKNWFTCIKQTEIKQLPEVIKTHLKAYSGFPGKIDPLENYGKTVTFILKNISVETSLTRDR